MDLLLTLLPHLETTSLSPIDSCLHPFLSYSSTHAPNPPSHTHLFYISSLYPSSNTYIPSLIVNLQTLFFSSDNLTLRNTRPLTTNKSTPLLIPFTVLYHHTILIFLHPSSLFFLLQDVISLFRIPPSYQCFPFSILPF